MSPENLLLVRVDPSSRHAAIEVLSEILTFAAFEIPLRILLLDRAAMLCSPDVDAELAGMVAAWPLYGVSQVFVENESLNDCALDPSVLPESIRTLPRAEVLNLLHCSKGASASNPLVHLAFTPDGLSGLLSRLCPGGESKDLVVLMPGSIDPSGEPIWPIGLRVFLLSPLGKNLHGAVTIDYPELVALTTSSARVISW